MISWSHIVEYSSTLVSNLNKSSCTGTRDLLGFACGGTGIGSYVFGGTCDEEFVTCGFPNPGTGSVWLPSSNICTLVQQRQQRQQHEPIKWYYSFKILKQMKI